MVSVSVETPQQTEKRLRHVIALADFVVHDGIWCFEESSADQPPTLTSTALAVIRDNESWSHLVPSSREHQGVE